MWSFMAAFVVIAKSTMNPPQCPSADDQISRMWSVHMVEYDSAAVKGVGY